MKYISFPFLLQAGNSNKTTMKKAYNNIPYYVKSFCSIATEFILSQMSAASSPIVVQWRVERSKLSPTTE
jgi:hypothetical protein